MFGAPEIRNALPVPRAMMQKPAFWRDRATAVAVTVCPRPLPTVVSPLKPTIRARLTGTTLVMVTR